MIYTKALETALCTCFSGTFGGAPVASSLPVHSICIHLGILGHLAPNPDRKSHRQPPPSWFKVTTGVVPRPSAEAGTRWYLWWFRKGPSRGILI